MQTGNQRHLDDVIGPELSPLVTPRKRNVLQHVGIQRRLPEKKCLYNATICKGRTGGLCHGSRAEKLTHHES